MNEAIEPGGRTNKLLSLMIDDLELCRKVLLLSDEEEGDDSHITRLRRECYIRAAALAYGRPFAAGDGHHPLGFTELDLHLTSAEREVHEQAIAICDTISKYVDVSKSLRRIDFEQVFDDNHHRLPVMKEPKRDLIIDIKSWLTLTYKVHRALLKKVFVEANK